MFSDWKPRNVSAASFFLTVCTFKTYKKRSKSHFVQLHSLSKFLTRSTVWVVQKIKTAPFMKFMKECTSTHINSTLKIYIQLKSQHGEPTAVSSISPTWFPPQFVNLASFTANVYNICTVHTFYNGDSFHWMTKEALNAVRLSETKYKVLIKNKKTTTHIQTDNNRYSEHLLGWQIDNTGMYFWRQTGKKKKSEGEKVKLLSLSSGFL